MPETGYVDLHSHLLPGIDDGCTCVEESVRCVERLLAHGFVGTVCTPHIWLEEFPRNTPANIARWVASLRGELARRGLDYQLWDGGEVRIAPRTVQWFRDHGVPTLGPGRCVLVDYWGHDWPSCGDEVVDYLLDNDYQPILAHPERMNLPDGELEGLLDDLRGRGVWLQGNLNSMAGGEGDRAHQRMQTWLAEGRYHVIASDMHRPFDLDGRMHGIDALAEHVGAEMQATLLQTRTREVLAVTGRGG